MTKAYDEGVAAFNSRGNENGCKNPYDIENPEYDEWEDGFEDSWSEYCEYQNWGGE